MAATLTPEQVLLVRQWIADVRERFQREADQGILKRDLYQAVESLGGREACDRLSREIDARCAMYENARQQLEIVQSTRERRRSRAK